MLIDIMLNKKECNCIPHKHKPFYQVITLTYFSVSQNANLVIKILWRKKIYGKFKEWIFVIVVETSRNKLLPLSKKTINTSLHKKIISLKFLFNSLLKAKNWTDK